MHTRKYFNPENMPKHFPTPGLNGSIEGGKPIFGGASGYYFLAEGEDGQGWVEEVGWRAAMIIL